MLNAYICLRGVPKFGKCASKKDVNYLTCKKLYRNYHIDGESLRPIEGGCQIIYVVAAQLTFNVVRV